MEENPVLVRLLASGKELFHCLWKTIPIGSIHMGILQEGEEKEDTKKKKGKEKRVRDQKQCRGLASCLTLYCDKADSHE